MPKPASALHTQADNSGSIDSMSDMREANGASSENGMDNSNMDDGNPDRPSDDMKLIDRPPANFIPNKKPDFPSVSFLDNDANNHDHDHDHDHAHDYPHDHGHDHDHDHHHHHHHGDIIYDHAPFSSYDDSLKHLHGFDAFPGIINLIPFFILFPL